ncbi:MAG: S41 family peptidase [Desulfosudaceae bacterium]
MKISSSKAIKTGMALLAVCLVFILTAGFQRTISASDSEAYQELKIFTNVIEELENSYVDPVNTKELLESAIKGMVGSLDPHSQYLPPDAFKDFQDDTEGEFEGLGIVITKAKGLLKIISPIEGTPAYRAGIQPGDIITKIDGESTEDMELWEAVKKMRGGKGTSVEISIFREGESEERTFTLVRDVIPITSVKSILLQPGYGYVWITNFQANTMNELTTAWDKLESENNGELKGMILDLRNNPGGLLDQAVSVSDLFLRAGEILTVKGREDEQVYQAHDNSRDKACPIVALINSGSASASEIVAGALQDHKRALIMGTPSFGKGSVQTIKPLGDGSGIKFTIARYYTPSGRSIQAKGIEPDITVPYQILEENQATQRSLKESDLRNHLESEPDPEKRPQEKDEGDQSNSRTSREDEESDDEDIKNFRYGELSVKKLLRDSQITRALDTLISYEIFKKLE